MPYTYDVTLPTERDHLRLRLDDFDVLNEPVFPDETYDALLAQLGFNGAGASLAQTRAAKFVQLASDTQEADAHDKWESRADFFIKLAQDFLSGRIQPPLITMEPFSRTPVVQGPTCPIPHLSTDLNRRRWPW